MLDLRELYQDLIIDHQKNPRNHRVIENATSQARGFNPLCGDKLTVYCNIENDSIQDLSFIGCGCAISQASASLMTEALCGKNIAEARLVFQQFHNMLTQDSSYDFPADDKLSIFAGVRTFPARVKCATLAWHTMEAAIQNSEAVVATE
jgi:nitrogen fixation protein NifU and related proteins